MNAVKKKCSTDMITANSLKCKILILFAWCAEDLSS
jgi:hypothetical protein